MEIELKGVDTLKDIVNRLGLFAKTMQMAADKIDDALSAHIAAMDTTVTRLEDLERRANEREEFANVSRQHRG